jgi:hypothetical protein
MCTVTFFPSADGFLITTNRDEMPLRATQSPALQDVNGTWLCFPKDEVGGGTWVAVDTGGRVACLLNGAFKKHKHSPPYRLSRGQIVLQSLMSTSFEDFLVSLDLTNIEPFTLLQFDKSTTHSSFEFRWDGVEKHIRTIDMTIRNIWQSAPLYDENQQIVREHIFEEWLRSNPDGDSFDVMDFHQSKHPRDERYDILIHRDKVRTVSISQVHVSESNVLFKFKDVLKKRLHEVEFEILPHPANR